MGGKAVRKAGVDARRMGTAEMVTLAAKFFRSAGIAEYRLARWFPEKEAHGDIDAGTVVAGDTLDWAREVRSRTGATCFVKNGHLFSFAFSGVQVDVNTCENEEILAARMGFMDFYPCSGIVRRMVKRSGLRWTQTGLYRGDDLLSRDPVDAIALVGIDAGRWQEGFSRKTEMFEWAAESPLFVKAIFAEGASLERPQYAEWVEYADRLRDVPASGSACREIGRMKFPAGEPATLADQLSRKLVGR